MCQRCNSTTIGQNDSTTQTLETKSKIKPYICSMRAICSADGFSKLDSSIFKQFNFCLVINPRRMNQIWSIPALMLRDCV